MFDFANPYLLHLLWLVPALFALFYLSQRQRRRRLARFGNPNVIASLMPDASPYKPAIKMVLRLVALAAIIFVLARPRAGEKIHQETTSGIEIMIAFDLSNSMLASATDDPKGPSRLDRARLILEKLIDQLENDKVGLVIFAGNAKTQFPMTTDFGMAKIYLSELSPALMEYQGTSLAEAVSMATNGFSQDKNVHKALILITDAEDHEGEAIEAAKAAAEKDIQINVIGLGSAKGQPIPVLGSPGEYITDNSGQTVYTTLNQDLAVQIAEAGKGIYVNGASRNALSNLADQLNTLEKSEFKHQEYTSGAEQFPVFAWIAFFLLIIDALISERKNKWLRKINFFSKAS